MWSILARALNGCSQTWAFVVLPRPLCDPTGFFQPSDFEVQGPQPHAPSGPRTGGRGGGHEVRATGVSHCQSPLPHSPRGLQEADLEWTTVKQSFQTEVQQLSR